MFCFFTFSSVFSLVFGLEPEIHFAMASTFGAILDIESARPTGPPRVLSKSHITNTNSVVSSPDPTEFELDEFNWGSIYNAPETPSALPSGAQTPITPGPSVPLIAAEVVQSWADPPINKWRFLSCCLTYMIGGLCDAAVGALIPYMETHYNIGYAVVSMIFVGQAVGFIGAAFFNQAIKSRLGHAKTAAFSQAILMAAFAIIIVTPPYPAVVIAFFLIGWGFSAALALNNVFCANLAGSSVVLGAGHGAYGVGGTIGPFIATAMASRGALWSRYYIITLLLAAIAAKTSWWSFKGMETTPLQPASGTANSSKASHARQLLHALACKVTILGALFTFGYQGGEVAISGWVISFLIQERNGNPSTAGYVTAGFWGGITLGRFILPPLANRLNQKMLVIVLGVLAIAFEMLVWFVPNMIGNSVAVALAGFMLGPLAPASVAYFVKLMPREIQTTALSFVSSAGSSGGALWPFITGLIAQTKGTWVLHPICIGLFALMLACWLLLPNVDKKSE